MVMPIGKDDLEGMKAVVTDIGGMQVLTMTKTIRENRARCAISSSVQRVPAGSSFRPEMDFNLLLHPQGQILPFSIFCFECGQNWSFDECALIISGTPEICREKMHKPIPSRSLKT